MKNDNLEDLKDIQEIRKQKEEQKRLKEVMLRWEFGKGITSEISIKKDSNLNV
jgi:hypothetical protein